MKRMPCRHLLLLVLFVIGVVMKQGNMIQREIWIMQRELLTARQQASLRDRERETAGTHV